MQGPEPGAAAAQPGHDGPSPTTGSPRSARPPQTAAMTRSWTRCSCGCTPRGPASPGTIRTYRAVSRFRQVSGRSSAGSCATRVVHDVSRAVGAVRGRPGFRRGCAQRGRTRLACQRNRVRRGDDQAQLADLTARQQAGQRGQDRPVSIQRPAVPDRAASRSQTSNLPLLDPARDTRSAAMTRLSAPTGSGNRCAARAAHLPRGCRLRRVVLLGCRTAGCPAASSWSALGRCGSVLA